MQIQVLAIKVFVSDIQWNLFNTDTKGTGISVRFTEVSVLEKQALYGFQFDIPEPTEIWLRD